MRKRKRLMDTLYIIQFLAESTVYRVENKHHYHCHCHSALIVHSVSRVSSSTED